MSNAPSLTSGLSRRHLGIVVAAALALRLALLATGAHDPVVQTPMLDAEYAVDWADRIGAGDFWGSPESTAYFRTPLYAWFLAGAFLLPGPDLVAARVLQALLGAATCGLLAGLAGRRLGRSAGLATGILAAVAWPLLVFGRELLIGSLVPFLGAAILWALDRASRRRGAAAWLLAGVLVGVAALARPTFLVLTPAALVAAATAPARGKAALAVIAGVLIAIAPVTVRNRIVSGDWIALSYQAGLNLWIGNNPQADGISARLPGLTSWRNEDVEALLAREAGHAVGPAEQDARYRGLALEFFRTDPAAAAGLLLKKTYYFLQGYEIRNNRDLYSLRGRDPILSLPLPDFGWVLPLAIVGVVARRRRWRDLAPWLACAVLAAAAVIAFFVCARYRLLAWPPLLLFAGAGAAALVDRRAGGAALAARFALLLAAVLLTRVDFLDVRHPDASQPHFQYGNVYARTGDAAAAEREYREALHLAPGFAEARFHLGALLLQDGRLPEALPELRSAAAAMPLSFRVRRSLAEALEAAGATDEALAARREAARLSAGAPDDVLALGNALGRSGRLEEAWGVYESLLSSPAATDPFLLLNAGQTALATGRAEAGLDLLRRATSDTDTRTAAYEALARYHLSVRDTKSAQRVLSEGILREPDQAPLHRLRALARYASGDLTGAVQDLERVVALDPADAESRQRLEEIRSGQGPR